MGSGGADNGWIALTKMGGIAGFLAGLGGCGWAGAFGCGTGLDSGLDVTAATVTGAGVAGFVVTLGCSDLAATGGGVAGASVCSWLILCSKATRALAIISGSAEGGSTTTT